MRVILIASTNLVDKIPDYRWGLERDTTEPDEVAEMAGRLDYLSWGRPNPATATNEGYLANILAQGHFSVLEHASATFYIDGVSRNFTHELIRHRHLSFSEVSQRYVDVSEFQFIQHPTWTEHNIYGRDDVPQNAEGFFAHCKESYRDVVRWLTEDGVKGKKARQAARMVMPGGTETKILVTGNMRAWREVLGKRLATKPETGEPLADLEFYAVAQKILQQLKDIAPNTFQDFDYV